MSETFAFPSAVELAVIERSGFVESRHGGSAIVLGSDGVVLRSLGDVTTPVFPRSTLKPFQALAVMTSGVELAGPDAVLATASHAGTPEHIAIVRRLLARADLPISALRCPADWPLDAQARAALIRAGENSAPLYMNCSGKHAAMLLACVQNGWLVDDYRDPEHPLQRRIRDVVERFTGEKVADTGVDGCGAPVHAISLTGLARGISQFATASEDSPFAIYRQAAILKRSVLENGWAIDGPGRTNTVVIERLATFAKLGAEGMLVMSAPNGTTVALKILDGSSRAATVVALTLLVQVGALEASAVAAILPQLNLAVTGGGRVVGQIRPTI